LAVAIFDGGASGEALLCSKEIRFPGRVNLKLVATPRTRVRELAKARTMPSGRSHS
jgi:hypothetical protein